MQGQGAHLEGWAVHQGHQKRQQAGGWQHRGMRIACLLQLLHQGAQQEQAHAPAKACMTCYELGAAMLATAPSATPTAQAELLELRQHSNGLEGMRDAHCPETPEHLTAIVMSEAAHLRRAHRSARAQRAGDSTLRRQLRPSARGPAAWPAPWTSPAWLAAPSAHVPRLTAHMVDIIHMLDYGQILTASWT